MKIINRSKILMNITILITMAALHTVLIFLKSAFIDLYFFAFRPIFYILLFIIFYSVVGRNEKKLKEAGTAPLIMGIVALLYIFLMFLSGVFLGFGKNPMFTGTMIFIKNIWIYVPFVFLSETIRVLIAKNTPSGSKVFMAVFITLIYTFVQIENLNNFVKFNLGTQIDYVITTVLPILVLNSVLTYVAFSGSFTACFILRGVYALIPVLSPVLPDISKILWAIMVYFVMFIAFIMYDRSIFSSGKKVRHQRYAWTVYIIPGILVIFSIAFGSGITQWNPVAIASTSMTGTFDRGSLVFIKKIPNEKVQSTIEIGDVIQFISGNISVVHRVVDIVNDSFGDRLYVTKGDNNPNPDQYPVKTNQIIGIARVYVPYLGYPAVFLMYLMSQ